MLLNDQVIQQVWEKARIDSKNDPLMWRKDACGAWIKRTEYANRQSQYGWEIDYIDFEKPLTISNFQPVSWKNHVNTSTNTLRCIVSSVGVQNKDKSEL